MVLLQYISNSSPALIRKSILIRGTILGSDVADFVERKGCSLLKKSFVLQDVKEALAVLE